MHMSTTNKWNADYVGLHLLSIQLNEFELNTVYKPLPPTTTIINKFK